ncbi:hypothetical protein AgCh_025599 [Apium graveolens]
MAGMKKIWDHITSMLKIAIGKESRGKNQRVKAIGSNGQVNDTNIHLSDVSSDVGQKSDSSLVCQNWVDWLNWMELSEFKNRVLKN